MAPKVSATMITDRPVMRTTMAATDPMAITTTAAEMEEGMTVVERIVEISVSWMVILRAFAI